MRNPDEPLVVLWNHLGSIGGPLPDETVRGFLPGGITCASQWRPGENAPQITTTIKWSHVQSRGLPA